MKAPAQQWGDVAWHFRMIGYGCLILAGLGALFVGWAVWEIYWHAPPWPPR